MAKQCFQEFLSASELARLTNVAQATLLGRIRSGELKSDGRTGKTILFRSDRLPEIAKLFDRPSTLAEVRL